MNGAGAKTSSRSGAGRSGELRMKAHAFADVGGEHAAPEQEKAEQVRE
jgi:hypothetical protein